MEFVRLDFDNNWLLNAESKGHQEIIREYMAKGYQYKGFLPVKFGPTGKTLAIELLFDK